MLYFTLPRIGVISLALIILFSIDAFAQDMARAETEYTPLGAIKAGNAQGTIPPWTGGITTPPPAYEKGQDHTDPFADDAPLFTITADNYKQYADKLSGVSIGLLTTYPESYKMHIYPSRRSCAFPQHVYDAAYKNIDRARLSNNGHNVEGALMAIPFPRPKTGEEVIWNHRLNYRGHKYTAKISGGNIYPNGSFTHVVRKDRKLIFYSDPTLTSATALENKDMAWMGIWESPPRNAGSGFSSINTIDQVMQPRYGFFFRNDIRKNVPSPSAAMTYDALLSTANGLRRSDDMFLFNGAHDRYEWTLLGKKEIYIPYNAYRASHTDVSLKDLLTPYHPNPTYIRYELHRVWVVEAVLKPEFSHIHHRRVIYIDEDSWIAVMAELYNAKGTMHNGQEAFIKNYYEVPTCHQEFDVLYNYENGWYNVDNVKNQFGPANFDARLSTRYFGPAALRRSIR